MYCMYCLYCSRVAPGVIVAEEYMRVAGGRVLFNNELLHNLQRTAAVLKITESSFHETCVGRARLQCQNKRAQMCKMYVGLLFY